MKSNYCKKKYCHFFFDGAKIRQIYDSSNNICCNVIQNSFNLTNLTIF